MKTGMRWTIALTALLLAVGIAGGAYIAFDSEDGDYEQRVTATPAGGGDGLSASCEVGAVDCNDTPGDGGVESSGSPDAPIAELKKEFPELRDYPSDALPPRAIKTERVGEGWYVAFVQEGSGRPVISATCFLVDDDLKIVSKKTYTPTVEEDSTAPFSPITCSS